MNFCEDNRTASHIVDEVLRLFDEGRIQHEEAFSLLKICEQNAKWSGVYLFPMPDHRCGCCFGKPPKSDAIFSLFKVFSSSNGCARVPSEVQERVFGYLVCEDCIRKLCSDYFDKESYDQLDFDSLKVDFGSISPEDLRLFDDFFFDSREEFEDAVKICDLGQCLEEEDVDEEFADEEEPQPLFGIDLGVTFSIGRVGEGSSHRK